MALGNQILEGAEGLTRSEGQVEIEEVSSGSGAGSLRTKGLWFPGRDGAAAVLSRGVTWSVC